MRHARSERSAFAAAMIGYSVTQILCYVIGLLALVTVARTPNDIYGAFIALPLGAVSFAVLAARELDQSFADVYSTAVSTQNLRPLWDRRILAAVITGFVTVLALFLNINDYENFLTLLGSVFVPMFGVLTVDFFLLSRGRWDLSAHAPSRWLMLLPWAAGFVTYQLINPGYVSWWASAWTRLGHLIGFTPASWMSASICSFAVAAIVTLLGFPLGVLTRRLRAPHAAEHRPAPGERGRYRPGLARPGGPAGCDRGDRAGRSRARHGKGPAEPDWRPLTADEVAPVLAQYGLPGAGHVAVGTAVTWRSPRPMSAAGLVRPGRRRGVREAA